MERHYGNFRRFEGDEPPLDYNWSAFIGSYLIQLYRQHKERFSSDIQDNILFALKGLASHRLAQLWNRPNTTNINILSVFFLLQAADVLNDDAMRQEAEKFWADFYSQSLDEGIREYNGLNYMSVHLYGLDFIAQHEKNKKISKQARDLQRRLLWSLSHRYHYKKKQLAGPFRRTPEDSRMGRNYSTLEAMLFKASNGRFPINSTFPANSDPLHATFALMLSARMPDDWIKGAKAGDNLNKHYRESVAKDAAVGGGYVQTTSYLDSNVLVGSVNHEPVRLVKRQKNRPLIAHLGNSEIRLLGAGTREHGNEIYFNSVQHKKSVLVEVVRENADENFTLWLDVLSEDAMLLGCSENLADMLVDGHRVVLAAAEDMALRCDKSERGIVVALDADNSKPMVAYSFVVIFDAGEGEPPNLPDLFMENGEKTTIWSLDGTSLLLKRNTDQVAATSFKIDNQEVNQYPLGEHMGTFFDHKQ